MYIDLQPTPSRALTSHYLLTTPTYSLALLPSRSSALKDEALPIGLEAYFAPDFLLVSMS